MVLGQQTRLFPTKKPTVIPTSRPTLSPETVEPTSDPTGQPTRIPLAQPTSQPTTQPSGQPSGQPTTKPTATPTISIAPTVQTTPAPTSKPTSQPTSSPTTGDPNPSSQPTSQPSSQPTTQPSGEPSGQPTSQPSGQPSKQPSSQPTSQPTGQPTEQPYTFEPSSIPTSSVPTMVNTSRPSVEPTLNVSSSPTIRPTGKPSGLPTGEPTGSPIGATFTPTSQPSGEPSGQPSGEPSSTPTTPPSKLKYNSIDLSSSTVVVDSKDTAFCDPLHFTMNFQFSIPVETPVVITIDTPGMTSGSCTDSTAGKNIETAKFLYSNNELFKMSYFEGTFANQYTDSYITIRVLTLGKLTNTTSYEIIVDRSNGLKFYCSNPVTDWTMKLRGFGEVNHFVLGTKMAIQSSLLENYCFWKTSSLIFGRAYQQFPVSMNVSMTSGWTLKTGTIIRIKLPSFTTSLSFPMNHRHVTDGTLVKGVDRRADNGDGNGLTITYSTTTVTWKAYWYEGDPLDFYKDSYMTLVNHGSVPSHTTFWIHIGAFPNSITPACGKISNSADISFNVKGPAYSFNLNESSFDTTSAIGSGCDMLNDCSGHGECDYCQSKCTCYDGYGSDKDLLTTDMHTFLPDCSSRRCPLGTSSGNIRAANHSVHTLRECSNNGLCNRGTGECDCFPGFTGSACQRRPCPGKPGAPFCSGRGSCLPMRDIAREITMKPLQGNEHQDNTSTYTVSKHAYQSEIHSWDAEVHMGCVCDSSWSVGIKRGQTQLAEFFGPSCEFKRCPSGDDPDTHTIDETDCHNKAQGTFNSSILGEVGNLCHVDCSNRGTCDYHSGKCRCYQGYTGHNCALIDITAYANGFSRAGGASVSSQVDSNNADIWTRVTGYDVDLSRATERKLSQEEEDGKDSTKTVGLGLDGNSNGHGFQDLNFDTNQNESK